MFVEKFGLGTRPVTVAARAAPVWDSIATAAQRLTEQILSRDGVSPRAIWLCGNSLGCNVALHVASKIDHRGASVGLVLRNPPALIPVIMRIADRYPMGCFVRKIAEELCDEMNAMKTAPLVSYPAVFMQSGEDEVVPPSIQNELIQVYGGDRRVVHLAGLRHAGLANPEQEVLIQSEIRWLWERTQRGQSTCTAH